jgi:MerR family transcriptional regulator, light-induced transcriptional regulator
MNPDSQVSSLSELGSSSISRSSKRSGAVIDAPEDLLLRDPIGRLVHEQVVPYLLGLGRPSATERDQPARRIQAPAYSRLSRISVEEVIAFSRLVIHEDEPAMREFVNVLRARGILIEEIYLDLIGGSARQVGTWWSEDDCNFCEVTLATWRLQCLMYELRSAFVAEAPIARHCPGTMVLATMVGEQHNLGLAMLAEFFRRAGWHIAIEIPTRVESLVALVKSQHVDLVGLSAANDFAAVSVPAAIRQLRAKSLNENLRIMLGGPFFTGHPDRARASGADYAPLDAREAVLQCSCGTASTASTK